MEGSESNGGRTRLFVLAGVGVVFLLALAAVAFVTLRGGDEGGTGAGGDGLAFPNGQVVPLFGGAPREAPEEQWTTEISCSSSCSIATDGRLVFVVQDDDGDELLEAFDASNGESVWRVDDFDGGEYGADLQRYGDLLLATTQTDDDGTGLTAFDPRTGEERWTAEGTWEGYVVGDLLLLRTWDGDEAQTLAVRHRDGEEVWRETGSAVGACGGRVVLGLEDEVAAVDATSGEEAWTADSESPTDATCAGDRVYLPTEAGVTALDLGSGDEVWDVEVDGTRGAAAEVGVLVVFGEEELVAFEAEDGRERWRQERDDVGEFAPFLLPLEGDTALAFKEEELALLTLSDGEVGRTVAEATLTTPAEGSLVEIDDEDNLRARSLLTLEELWETEGPGDPQDVAVGGGRVFVLAPEAIVAYG